MTIYPPRELRGHTLACARPISHSCDTFSGGRVDSPTAAVCLWERMQTQPATQHTCNNFSSKKTQLHKIFIPSGKHLFHDQGSPRQKNNKITSCALSTGLAHHMHTPLPSDHSQDECRSGDQHEPCPRGRARTTRSRSSSHVQFLRYRLSRSITPRLPPSLIRLQAGASAVRETWSCGCITAVI